VKNPAGVKGESWDILEEKCESKTTKSIVTSVWTTDRSDATADETEVIKTHTTENFVVTDEIGFTITHINKNLTVANETKMREYERTEKQPFFTLLLIIVITLIVTVFISIVVVVTIGKYVTKGNLNHNCFEDQDTGWELTELSSLILKIRWSFYKEESSAEDFEREIT